MIGRSHGRMAAGDDYGRCAGRARRCRAGWRAAVLAGLLALAACRETDDTLPAPPTLAPTAAVATAAVATAGLVTTIAPTVAVVTATAAPTATRTPTATPQPTPCQFAVLPALQPAWLDIELGCPINAGVEGLSTAYAPFAGGQMLWRGDNAQIYVLTNDGRWAQYDDLWQEGDAEFTCGEANNPPTPVRGFGRVWCDHAAVREGLGAATAAEIGDSGGRAQDFVNGLLLAAPDGSTFVLIGETATWRRVWPDE